MSRKVILLLAFLHLYHAAFPIDLDASNKLDNGTSIYDTPCNKDTQIDFYFNADTVIQYTSPNVFVREASKSSMKFLDALGNDLELTLRRGTLTNQDLVSQFTSESPLYFYFEFENDDGDKKVDVIVPIIVDVNSAYEDNSTR